MKKLLALLLALAMVFSMAACTGGSSNEGGGGGEEEVVSTDKWIRIGMDMTNFTTMDVFHSDYNEVLQASDAVFDRLFNKNKDTLELEPCLLAEMPTVSEDGLTYTCKLRQDVKWSDGTPLTAKDVEFTLNYFYAKDTASENTWISELIQGCLEMEAGEADTLEGFKLIDDYTFEITLYEPYGIFEATMATSYMAILPAHLRPNYGDEWGTTVMPVGSGPYKVESFDPGVKLVLVPNENYWGEVPDIDGIIITNMDSATAIMEYEAGNIDFCKIDTDLVEDTMKRFPDNVHEQLVVGGTRIGLNTSMAPLDNPKVRQAFAMAVDREGIISGYYQNHVAPLNGVIPAGIPGNDGTLEATPYDLDAAKALLTEAGYPDGITLDVAIRESQSDFAFIFQYIQDQASQIGINLNITKMDSSAYSETRQNNQIMVTMTQIYADFIDSYQYVYNQFNSKVSDRRSIGLHDDWFDEKSNELLCLSGAENAKLARELDEYLCKEIYATIPICQDKMYYLCTDRVNGLFIKSDNLFNFSGLSVE